MASRKGRSAKSASRRKPAASRNKSAASRKDSAASRKDSAASRKDSAASRNKSAARKRGPAKAGPTGKVGTRKKTSRKAVPGPAKGSGSATPESPELVRLRSLLGLMEEHGLLELEVGPDSVRLSKAGSPSPAPAPLAPMPAAAPGVDSPEAGDSGLVPFPSPMVGTFYRAPSPETDPYVVEGDRATAGSTLCIIEAMKVFNEIKAEMSGVVAEILVENGEAVEYGQPLFMFKTD